MENRFSCVRFGVVSLVACLGLSARAAPVSEVDRLAGEISANVGCDGFADRFWDSVIAFPLHARKLPDAAAVRSALAAKFTGPRFAPLGLQNRMRLAQAVIELYVTVSKDAVTSLSKDPGDAAEVLEIISGLEMGDRTSAKKVEIQNRIEQEMTAITRLAGTLTCPQSIDTGATSERARRSYAPGTLLGDLQRTRDPAVFGALKSIAVAYQSCDAGQLPALNASTPDVKGVVVSGHHPNGIGLRRKISDLPALLSSDPYYSSYSRPDSGCFDVLARPMIYNYGGKPYTTTDRDATLDFFRGAGSGQPTLGIDCSGFVFSSLATAGLRLKKSAPIKTSGVYGVNAKMYMNPQRNGLTCLAYAEFDGDSSLQPGDILASEGHVLMIEDVGLDPFGIDDIENPADCTKNNIRPADFNFTIVQSSASNNGIGINRYRGADFLGADGDMHDEMIANAVDACLAKTQQNKVTTHVGSAALVRHSHSADCMEPGVLLEHEDCLATCRLSP